MAFPLRPSSAKPGTCITLSFLKCEMEIDVEGPHGCIQRLYVQESKMEMFQQESWAQSSKKTLAEFCIVSNCNTIRLKSISVKCGWQRDSLLQELHQRPLNWSSPGCWGEPFQLGSESILTIIEAQEQRSECSTKSLEIQWVG